MKHFLPIFIAAAALMPSVATAATVAPLNIITPAGGEYVAADLAGQYAFDYYSLVETDGGFIGQTSGNDLEIVAAGEDQLTLRHFFNETADNVPASFSAADMTIRIKNGQYLGSLREKDDNFEGYLSLIKETSAGPELYGEYIEFKVDPAKRCISFALTEEMMSDGISLMVANKELTRFMENFRDITLYYANARMTYRVKANDETSPTHNLGYLELNKEATGITAYNFNAEGWYDRCPVVFMYDASAHTVTARNQYYFYDTEEAEFNFWISAVGNRHYTLVGDVKSSTNGYVVEFPDWGIYDADFNCALQFLDYRMYIFGEFFGKPAATPVISIKLNDEQTEATVSITAADGATIYYTTDGTVPSHQSTEYKAPFTVDKNLAVRAFAAEPGLADSFLAMETVPIFGAVEGVEADSAAVSVEGRDIMLPAGARVYALSGAEVSARGVAPGIYLVRLATGKTVKVLVK